ncbi:unnamed protein product [Staurois parvus]|uniref:Secreted protein n=1 Tax=Staurois parvus TaxID=386267 RepID=A0ABN9HG64_9NEOB|nr:unnamed protein product [Staurois parvus]
MCYTQSRCIAMRCVIVHVLAHLGTTHKCECGVHDQGRTDHLETRALPEGPGSVGGPMRCPWYLFHRLF